MPPFGPILTADDIIRAGACIEGVYRVLNRVFPAPAAAMPLSCILPLLRDEEERRYVLKAAEANDEAEAAADGFGYGDGYGYGGYGGCGFGYGDDGGYGCGYGGDGGYGEGDGVGDGRYGYGFGGDGYGDGYGRG